jgi:prepilin-type N-terminal cleavage/methylation domain-containing protein
MKDQGFTLIELMIVVAIVAILALLAVPTFSNFLAKSKRSEAYVQLHSIYAAQKAYWLEHGKYAQKLNGPDGLGWKPEGYSGGGSNERFYYTYGFANGQEGQHHFTGKLQASSSHLSRAHAGKDSFMVVAAADIDGDGKADVLGIDQFNTIIILEDDLS